jgi:hypothetical protein
VPLDALRVGHPVSSDLRPPLHRRPFFLTLSSGLFLRNLSPRHAFIFGRKGGSQSLCHLSYVFRMPFAGVSEFTGAVSGLGAT